MIFYSHYRKLKTSSYNIWCLKRTIHSCYSNNIFKCFINILVENIITFLMIMMKHKLHPQKWVSPKCHWCAHVLTAAYLLSTSISTGIPWVHTNVLSRFSYIVRRTLVYVAELFLQPSNTGIWFCHSYYKWDHPDSSTLYPLSISQSF